MTLSQLKRIVRALHYRRKLLVGAETLEARITAYLVANELTNKQLDVSGLKVQLSNDELVITETPQIEERQLDLLKDSCCRK